MSCELRYVNVLYQIFPVLHINDTPAVPPATGFDVKIHLFDTSNFFFLLARARYMREALRKLNGRCVGIRCAIGWLRECRYDNAIIFRAHCNCTGDSNLIIYDMKVHSVLGERIVMILYCCSLQVALKCGLCYGHSLRTVRLL